MPVTFRLKGVENLKGNLEKSRKILRARAKKALKKEAERILKLSKDVYVPIDTYELHDSGRVVMSFEGSNQYQAKIIATIEFTAKHAIVVHEHPSAYDPPSWRGKQVKFTRGGPKFLEIPMKQASMGIEARLARDIKISRVA